MPSPVGHTIAGGIIYLIKTRSVSRNWKKHLPLLLFFIIYANLPDIDYLQGFFVGDMNRYHNGITHSLGFAVAISLLSGFVARFFKKKKFWDVTWWSFVLVFSHLLLDLFNRDLKPPYGIMLFWPLSNRYFISPVSIFLAPLKRNLSELFSLYNVGVVIVEIGILLPILFITLLYRYKKGNVALYE